MTYAVAEVAQTSAANHPIIGTLGEFRYMAFAIS